MSWTITCACGWTVGGDEDDVVRATQEHGRRFHNMDVTREQAMAMASPLVENDTEHGEARSLD
jgi:hypothetical protein